jgi:hypothetical protein
MKLKVVAGGALADAPSDMSFIALLQTPLKNKNY